MYEGTLSRPMSDDADRGQLLVIVGLIIAVSFIGLAVALNAAIFSENLSTRESVDAEEAAAYAAVGDRQRAGGCLRGRRLRVKPDRPCRLAARTGREPLVHARGRHRRDRLDRRRRRPEHLGL
ncbi:hypothetical protein BRD02_07705 [Halobacteriales archaeon QS_8_69_73]|nr:MAG: hypothetical protein BRD02_07705 [Halobacteriales archaeon QS_8_69_73]